MKKNLQYIYIAFGISIAIVIVISSLLSGNISSIINNNSWVEHTHQVKNQILKVQMDLMEAENSQRGYLLTENESLLKPFKETQKDIFGEIDSLQKLTRDNPEQQPIIAELRKVVSLRYQVLYETITAADGSQLDGFLKNASRGNEIMKTFMSLSNKMDETETRLLMQRTRRKIILENGASRYLILILIISCVFQMISFIVIIKAFRRRDQYQAVLEDKIKELNLANIEMEQIAFVASHDLQEPLRKIRTFSDRLVHQYKDILNEEGKAIIDKMSVASLRMQELLNDLINYTRVTKNDEKLQQVNLKQCIEKVCKDFNKVIETTGAVIQVEELPLIGGYSKQLSMLFSNLIDNCLKFSKPNNFPLIHITAKEVTGTEVGSKNRFLKISLSDNGIGFKKEFAEKIFIIFQRLHTHDSPIAGKGIGLAICKRVMINHKGFITATSEPNAGATFNLYFPANTNE